MPGLRRMDLVGQSMLEYNREKLLLEIPVGDGESLNLLDLKNVVQSLPMSNQGTALWTSPHSALEYNLALLAVDAKTVHTVARADGSRGWPRTAADMEWLWKHAIHDQGLDGSDWWQTMTGGTLVDNTTFDLSSGTFTRRDPDADAYPEISYGPRGIARLWSHNAVLKAQMLETAAQSLTNSATVLGSWANSGYASAFTNLAAYVASVVQHIAQLFGAENTTSTFQNLATYTEMPRCRWAGSLMKDAVVLYGGWRDDVRGTEDWYMATEDSSSWRQLLDQFFTGSRADIVHAIKVRNDADAKRLRSLLFGGIIHTEGVPADSAKAWIRQMFNSIDSIDSTIGQFVYQSTWSPATVNIHTKGVAFVRTPYLDTVEEARTAVETD